MCCPVMCMVNNRPHILKPPSKIIHPAVIATLTQTHEECSYQMYLIQLSNES